jgi:hypothetical protein
LAIILSGNKLFTTFQTYISHEVLGILGNVLHCSKEPRKCYELVDYPADSGAAETYTADERKNAVSLPAKSIVCVVILGDKMSYSSAEKLRSGI